jgi:LmbE family N-acetylglucosaminyl deacetylase
MIGVPLGSSDRVLVVAPHPDDETLGAGGLIQRAVAAGAVVRVVFLTAGEANPWAQRATELRWRIGPAERRGFAARRRAEAIEALQILGVEESHLVFLGLPDRGLTELLLHRPAEIVGRLRTVIAAFSPTLMVGPSCGDLHPDHSATAVALEVAVAPSGSFRRLAYTIHGSPPSPAATCSDAVELDAAARARKRRAVAAHRSQLRLRGRWLRSFVRGEERFFEPDAARPAAGDPVSAGRWDGTGVRLELRSRSTLRAFGERTVLLVAATAGQGGVSTAVIPARPRRAGAVASGEGSVRIEDVQWRGGAGRGLVRMAVGVAPWRTRLFVKIDRRHGFFDEAGWVPLPVPCPSGDERPPAAIVPAEARP